MPRDTRMDFFKHWLFVGVQDLGEPVVEELLLEWLDPIVQPAAYKVL